MDGDGIIFRNDGAYAETNCKGQTVIPIGFVKYSYT